MASSLRQSISNEILVVDFTFAVSSGVAYTAGDALCVKVDLANAVEEARGAGEVVAVAVADLDKQGADIDFLFFDDALTSTPAANTALDLDDADLAKFVGMVQVTADSLLVDNGVAYAAPATPLPFVLVGTSLWCVPVVRGTPTYTAAANVSARFFIRRC